MLGRKKGKFDGGERVRTPRCVNLVEEKKKLQRQGEEREIWQRGKIEFQHYGKKNERASMLGKKRGRFSRGEREGESLNARVRKKGRFDRG